MTRALDLLDLARDLDLQADSYDHKSPRRQRLECLADAARELDRLRDYRRFMAANLFRMPLGDVAIEAEGVRENVRDALMIAADLRSWAYQEFA